MVIYNFIIRLEIGINHCSNLLKTLTLNAWISLTKSKLITDDIILIWTVCHRILLGIYRMGEGVLINYKIGKHFWAVEL